jgi:hypothetical protein
MDSPGWKFESDGFLRQPVQKIGIKGGAVYRPGGLSQHF